MTKSAFLLAILWVASLYSYAQVYALDGLRFGQTGGPLAATARMQAVGGGHVSLGGDLSAAIFNPAGLGFYNRSTASITLGVDLQNSSDTYLGTTSDNFNNNLSLSQGAFAIHFPNDFGNDQGFRGSTLSFGFARVNDFNRAYRYQGTNTQSSVIDLFLDQATDLNIDNLNPLAFAAYDQFLIDYFDLSTNTDFFIDDVNGIITPNLGDGTVEGYSSLFGNAAGFFPEQSEVIEESGNQYRFHLSWGGNYQDQLYFGAGLGVESIYFNRTRRFEESNFTSGSGETDFLLNGLSLNDRIVTRGAGVNFSAGAIYRPVPVLTVGLNYQSPSYLTLNEESDFSLAADWNSFQYIDVFNSADTFDLQSIEPYRSAITETRYSVRTAGRWTLGSTVFINKNGFLSADVELVNYTQTRIDSDDFSTVSDNNFIEDRFESVANLRVGAEYRLQPILVRAGYAYYPDPLDAGRDRDFITFGAGYRNANFYLDVAVVLSSYEEAYAPYNLSNGISPTVNSEVNSTQIRLTTGFNL